MDWIKDVSERMPAGIWNCIVAVIAILLGLIIKFLIHIFLSFNYKRSDYFLFKSISNRLSTVAVFIFPLLVFNIAMPLMRMNKVAYAQINKIVEVLITICFAAVLIGIIKIFEDIIYHRFDPAQTDNLKERKIRTQLQFVRRFIIMLIVLITLALVLLSFESLRKIGSGLLTGVGVGGIIIGFAAQKSLGNLLAGFQIAFTQPMRIDDVLIVEGEYGRVEEINLTYVVLRLWDQRRLVLPINYFIEKPFQNWTRSSAELLATVYLYLDYNVPVDKLREELSRLLNQNELWDKRVNVLHVTDAKENTIELRALMSARNSGEAFDLRCYIRENMIDFIRTNFPDSLPKTRAELQNRTEQTA